MDEPTVVVGKVTKAHGVRGEVSILVISDNPDRFAAGAAVYLEDGRALAIRSSRSHGGRLLVTFEDVGDRDTAGALRGRTLVVPVSMLPGLPEGEWWPHQLEGCEVVTEAGLALGRLADVIPNPANDIWVARDEDGTETLVPALKDVIVSVDVAAKRIVVRDVPGLTTPE
ncbi:MAG: 16S rRNA processing protein RimM [Actinobacteria bacterium]|nr:16S rRNA processing protein RimM [Actinomycetota bacterium]